MTDIRRFQMQTLLRNLRQHCFVQATPNIQLVQGTGCANSSDMAEFTLLELDALGGTLEYLFSLFS